MCGRYTLKTPGDILAETFGIEDLTSLEPRYNIAPTQGVPILRLGRDAAAEGDGPPSGAEMAIVRWGLVPSWADDPSIGNRMIIARSETAAERPAFRAAFRRRRCLIPADGFYEWQRLGDRKQPHYACRADRAPFAFAGLWEHWRDEGRVVESCALLTTRPNELLEEIHDRMPVILPAESYAAWLGLESAPPEELQRLLRPYPADAMTAFPVSSYVNSPANDDARCIEPLGGRAPAQPRLPGS